MAERPSRSKREKSTSTAASLPPHIRDGLEALVRSDVDTVAEMLDAPKGTNVEQLLDKIAQVTSP